MTEFLQKNKKEILIIFGTITFYYIINFLFIFVLKMVIVDNAFAKIGLPFIFSILVFAITKQRLFFILIVGIAVATLAVLLSSSFSFILMSLPGFISSLLSAVVWQNIKKSLIIGVITSVVFYISIFIFLFLGFFGSIGHI